LWLHDDQACFEIERGSVRCTRIEAVGFGERQRRNKNKKIKKRKEKEKKKANPEKFNTDEK